MSSTEKEKVARSNPVKDFFGRMGIVGELFIYLWSAKMWWLIPMVVLLIVFAVLIILGSTGSGSPFIYTIF